MIQREWQFQRTANAFLSKALPHDAYYSAIDVGTAGGARLGALRKARGVKPGIPDVLIVWRGRTLWIELKSGTSLSEAQKITRDQLRANGHMWALARSIEDLETALIAAQIPLRATVVEIRDRIAEQNSHLPNKPKRPRTKAPRPLNSLSLAQYHRLNQKGLL